MYRHGMNLRRDEGDPAAEDMHAAQCRDETVTPDWVSTPQVPGMREG